MSLKTQAKVLRVLEEQAFERVGGKETLRVDVRVIAASNQNLQEQIGAGRFREDLFYRLNVIPIEVPPLRKRKEDIPALVEHFIALFSAENGRRPKTIAARGARLLPHLRLAGQRARAPQHGRAAGHHGPRATSSVPRTCLRRCAPAKRRTAGDDPQRDRKLKDARDAFERAYILGELRAHEWNMTRTAEKLGIERSHLYRKLKTYGIARPSPSVGADRAHRRLRRGPGGALGAGAWPVEPSRARHEMLALASRISSDDAGCGARPRPRRHPPGCATGPRELACVREIRGGVPFPSLAFRDT